MKFKNNAYYNPEDCGVTIFDTLEEADLGYEYNTLLVIKKLDDNTLWWAEDSGCSCPTPFEDSDFDQLTKESYRSFATSVNDFPVENQDKLEMLRKVRDFLGVRLHEVS